MEFKILKTVEAKKDNSLVEKMKNIIAQYDYLKDMVPMLAFGEPNEYFVLSYREETLLGFASVEIDEAECSGELSWFIVDKNLAKGFTNKLLLDEVIMFCKSKGVKELNWACLDDSWMNVKKKKEVFERFGYKTRPTYYDFTMSLDLE